MIRVTTRYRFSASHRLDTPALSPEQNRALYGKCNNPFGHGHDYVLDVTVEGNVDANGLAVDRNALDAVVRARVLNWVDHKNLNSDLPEFCNVVPTTENLAAIIEQRLTGSWNLAPRLARVRVSETARNSFELEVGVH